MTSATDDRAESAAAAIRHHYDVDTEFYRLWLDPSLTYSCAIRENDTDTLDIAQDRKLRYHCDAIGAESARAVLDIGCGWGSILRRLSADHRVARAVGLTLSPQQAEFIRAAAYPGVEVRTENWMHYQPDTRFDGIISIGAFEHFARPDDSPAVKIRVYTHFFERCREWLTDDGALSLQTICYADMDPGQANSFIQQEIFPDADLPTFAEITAAAEGVFEVRALSNGRLDYAWTCEQWAARLRRERAAATALVGGDVVDRYLRYLRMSALGFRMGKIGLLRLVLTPYGRGHFDRGGTR
ncbi:class I SAM-dependent methyltransferase [Nocardia sp. 2]|uniref:Class I SAM-dependent methyltransferase n=1 Tax=Nocardia acididurans TaxID=2802282 RepID=A0ABS1MDG1_9NOCA|nr:cyclopropane-fatty-acyl-phospholipid synthase family protein [Nocardia acididurans]MBL1078304.1 class I SAM-dependent methyltransferase [Nocardia acididurans]